MSDKIHDAAKRLLAIATEKRINLSEEQANIYAEHLTSSGGELFDDELSNVSGGACSGEPKESEKGLTCPSCGGGLSWDYDTSWTIAKCRKCKKLYVYESYGFVEVNID